MNFDMLVAKYRVWIIAVLGCLLAANQQYDVIPQSYLLYINFVFAMFSTFTPPTPPPPTASESV